MARQMVYPKHYPTGDFETQRAAAWVFLRLNEREATEAVIQWFQAELNRLEYVSMARAAKKGGKDYANDKAEWSGFANIDLSEQDKQAVRGGILDGESVLEIIGEMLGTGHKLSISYDPERDTVTGAVTGVYKNCKNAGLTCTSFARTLSDVLTVIAYKHEVIAKGDWSKFVSRRAAPDDLG